MNAELGLTVKDVKKSLKSEKNVKAIKKCWIMLKMVKNHFWSFKGSNFVRLFIIPECGWHNHQCCYLKSPQLVGCIFSSGPDHN